MASYNICSLMAKFDDVVCLLEKFKLDVLCLNETLLNSSVPNSWLEICGYTLFRNGRGPEVAKNYGGRVAVYIKDNRNVSHIPNGCFSNNNTESMWLIMDLPKSKPSYL